MSEALLAARSKVALQKPYFGSALWALKFVEVRGFAKKYKAAGHIAVDKYWRIYYDPDVIGEWPLKVRMGALVHELSHVLRRHDRRAWMHGVGPENFLTWNVCADAEIDDDIQKDDKLELPEGAITPKTLKMPEGLTAEEYYDNLPKKHIKVCVSCGSGAHGQTQPWEKEAEGRAKVEAHEAEAISRMVAERIKEEKNKGDIPAGWQRWAESYANPRVDWRKELASSIRRAAGDVRGLVDYSYRFPNRRQAAYGNIVMPAMVKPDPNISIVADTSGSMGEEDLSMALGEIKGILSAMGNRSARFYAVDAEVHVAKRIQTIHHVEFKGGGGTSMPVGIERAMKDRPKPDVIVVITDGYTDWMESGPSCKLIACIVNEEMEGPDYAKTINIPPKKEASPW